MPLLTASLGAHTVRRVGFGAMQLPGKGVFGPPRDHDQALAVIRRAREAGVDHIDTASFYGPDVANALLAEALAPWDEQVRVVSKVGARRDDQAAWLPALSPEDIRASVAQDLAVLQRDRLTAVNLRLHEGTDDDTMWRGLDALSGLVDEGRVEHIGVSTVSLRQLELALESAPVVCVQNQYGLLDRSGEDVLIACGERGIAFVPYFPLGSAFGAAPRPADDPTVQQIATELGATASQVALAWLLHHADHLLLIPGTSSLAHLEENLGCAEVALSAEQLQALDALAQPG